ncbi:ubiquinone/menaquinone biosynthesis methyltransferase [Desulfobulbus alkaliphilus]|uniref:ubiquinone/menaquinone biosynthesis methyltransferase n=1 Tax=Desulfobulbus alkaliphilus TaxID=869814 RepID=UPI0019643319|nr:ubiquinone/menaquinone biosynthesis methyltransferase [Desulfobulbus alkaliphilus]MBM9538434.1 ubiquinone/menaquinone biosynthesis methyltransferase [Desulfobulbus alkaliphilus]
MPTHVPYGYQSVSPEEKRRRVLGHFETIAQRYDLADLLLSGGLHFWWRRKAMRLLQLQPGESVLDLCGGTADFAVLAARDVGPSGTVVVCDISPAMMIAGRSKARRAGVLERIQWVQGDAERMGLADQCLDAVIVGYGLRNLVSLENGLEEILRVLKPGGQFMAMEFSIPQAAWLRFLYHQYSFRVMPWAGRMITGSAAPFHYLAESIRVFPPPEKIRTLLINLGLERAAIHPLSNGLAVLFSAVKPPVHSL